MYVILQLFNLNFTEKIFYLLSRFLYVSIKPSLLLYLTLYSTNQFNQILLSQVFLLIPLFSLFINFDTHKDFYQFYFTKENRRRIYLSFYFYISSTFFLSLFSALIISVYFVVYINITFYESFSIFFYFLSEKFTDERLRFELFSKKVQNWNQIVFFKIISNYIAFFLFIKFNNSVFLFLLIPSILMLLKLYIDFKKIKFNSLVSYFKIEKFNKIFIKLYRCRLIFMNSLLSTSFSYIDRMIVYVNNTSFLPLYTLMVFSFSPIQMFVDYFYTSFNRIKILKKTLSFKDILYSNRLILILFLSIVFSFLLLIIISHYKDLKLYSMFNFALSILLNQILLSYTNITKEIIYWANLIKYGLVADFLTWILLLTMTYVLYLLNCNELLIFYIIPFILFLRLFYLGVIVNKNSNYFSFS